MSKEAVIHQPLKARSAVARRGAKAREPVVRAVVALGLTQIICWGTTIYALGILATPIVNETHWSRSVVFGGLSVALIVSAIVSTSIGRQIDHNGARAVMSMGTGIVAVALTWIAFAQTPISYLAAWALLGPGMRMTLYDAAFAALVQVSASHGRRAISFVTLFGGFASTLFWPLGHELAVLYGWRATLLIYAAVNLIVCLPLHWWGLAQGQEVHVAGPPPPPPELGRPASSSGCKSTKAADPESQQPAAAKPLASDVAGNLLTGRDKRLAIALFALASSASGFIIGAVAVHLVDLIAASGLAMASAVFIASLKGVAQVAGRIWDIVFARTMRPMTLGRVAVGFLLLSFAVLIVGAASLTTAMIFTLSLGIGNGLVTIMRGALPLLLFGARGYGEVLGIVATPVLLTYAIAPTIVAFVIDLWGYQAGELLLLGVALLAYLAIEAMALWLRRKSRAQPPGD